MGVIIPVGYGQAAIHFRCSGASKDSVITLGYNPTTLDPAEDAESIYSHLTSSSAGDPPYEAGNMSSSWTFKGVSCTEMDDTGPLLGEFFQSLVGTATLAVPPVNCTMLISKNSSVGGRKGRGRMFPPVCGIAESAVDPMGVITTLEVNAQQDAWDLVYDRMVADDLLPVILHSSAGTPAPITSFTVQSTIATQRRRLR